VSQASVFISYSHKDETWKDLVVQHLRVLADEQGFDVWDDRRIGPGQEWKAEITRAIESADVALLLVSVDFLTSPFIRGEEIPPLLRLRHERRLDVVPVIVRGCAWQEVGWLGRLQARPKDGKPLNRMSEGEMDEALASLATEVSRMLARAKPARAAAAAQSQAARSSEPPLPAAPTVEPASAPPAPRRVEAPEERRPAPARPEVAKPTTPPPKLRGRPLALLGAAARSVPVWLIGLTALAIGVFLWMRSRPEQGSAQFASTASPSPASPSPDSAGVTWPAGITPSSFSFDSVTVDERGNIAARQKGTAPSFTEWLDGVALEMVAIQGGTFKMGSPPDEAERGDHEGPQRPVTVAPFFLGKFEITQAQWRIVARWPQVAHALDAEPAHFKGDDLPVEQVSWHDAVEFCARLSQRTGRAYRLASEAEWEYAARAGTTTPFHFGATITPEIANYDGNYPYGKGAKGEYRQRTTPVGSFGVANAFGLFDMHGNVWERVQDPWHANYAGAPSDGRVWEAGGDTTLRVVRGGSWGDDARNCRSAYRSHGDTDFSDVLVGFRVLCSVARTR
jgi:formylglycine-generating enzyme required for sulfatase activity